MNEFYAWFWAAMIFLSIAWYAVLLFYVGVRGGREIVEMTDSLSRRQEARESQPVVGQEPDRPLDQGGADGIR